MDDNDETDKYRSDGPFEELPRDVKRWLRGILENDEYVASCLFADILPNGKFGERWNFLTNRRLIVLSPNGKKGTPDVVLEIPLEELRGARTRSYVGSSSLIVTDEHQGHEIARFSLGSNHEALDLAYYINEIVKQRKEQVRFEDVPPPVTKRPSHRCSSCGRVFGRRSRVCPHCMDRRKIFMRLLSYLVPHLWLAVSGLLLTLFITGMRLMPPYLVKVLIDDVITPGNVKLLPVVVGILAAVNIIGALLSVCRTYLMQWLGQRVLFEMRTSLFRHLQLLRLRYYTQRQTGRIMSRVTSDLNRLQYFISEGLQGALVSIMSMFLIATILAVMNWRLFLLALAPTPIIVISTWIFGHKFHLIYHRIWRRMAGLNAILADTIPGIRVVKAFAQEDRESKNFESKSIDLFEKQMGAAKVLSFFYPFIQIQTALGSILIFSVGGYMVIKGQTTVGTLVAFTGYMMRFYTPIRELSRMNHRFQHCITSAERVFEVFDAEPEPLLLPGIRLSPFKGKVEFSHVRFSYEPGKYALDDINFTVEPGEMIGLVGPSGAGKSTLVHLIARFYEVEEGEIRIDGHPVEDLDLSWFRRHVGVVLQEPYLFYDTVWANIAYSNPQAGPADILRAAKAANAHEFIMNLADGYDTVIGERGHSLSGGERQRISIARAVLCDPQILILDEATASVDTETEALIQAALEKLIENRTTFAIAHRLSTLRAANRLIVLERSKLAEIGTHRELIESGGLYSRLCSMQSELSKMRAW